MDFLRLIALELAEIAELRLEGKHSDIYLDGAQDRMESLRTDVLMFIEERKIPTEEDVMSKNRSGCITGGCDD